MAHPQVADARDRPQNMEDSYKYIDLEVGNS